jgi:uncharacterized protein YecE (DUF72 family)
MREYVGTSGWMYSWNEGGSLDWYVRESGLNAIELNASFYRYPFPNQVKAWAEKGKSLKWVVKVNRAITHLYKLNKNSHKPFERFMKLFNPLNNNIAFYLFQLPPILTPNALENIARFQERFHLGKRFALEARNQKWFNEDVYKKVEALGITIVSVDSPQGSFIIKTGKDVYLRIHGRIQWYAYAYSKKELLGLARRIKELRPSTSYIFFNNDHAMLSNARTMIALQKH